MMLTILKFIAGYLGNSQALIADAIHSFTDMITDCAIIIGSFFWGKPPDENHPHGHQRIETLATIIVGLFILGAGLALGWHAIVTIKHPSSSSHPGWLALSMVFTAMISKEILCRWTLKFGRKLSSTALIANAWEHRSDAIASIPVLFAIYGTMLFQDLALLDNIGAIIVALFIIKTALKILMPRINEVLESGAPPETLQAISKVIVGYPGVLDIHKLRTRYLGANLLLNFHMVVAAQITIQDGYDIVANVRKGLFANFPDLIDIVIHLEPDTMGIGPNHQDDEYYTT